MAFNTPMREIIDRNSNGLLGKHQAWGRFRLGDVAIVQNGAAFKSVHFNTEGRGMPLLRIRDITRGATETWYDGDYDDEHLVRPGDLVIGMDGDFNHTRWEGPPALLNQRVCRLVFRSDIARKDWVLHVLGGYLQAINEATPSVTVKHLSSRTVADLHLPLPPRAEQERIADRLDDLLAAVATGIKNFERALHGLDAYLTSLIHREVRSGTTAPLGDVARVSSGLTKGRRTKDEVRSWAFLRAANLRDGFLDLNEIKMIEATEKEANRFRLQSGDVLMVEGSGTPSRLGQGWVWGAEVPNCLHQNHVFRARPDQSKVRPGYLAWVMQSPLAKAHFRSIARTTSGLATINKRQVSALPVPMLSLSAQEDAEKALDAAGRAVEMTRAQLRSQLKMNDALVQSIRRDAVEGRLVEQERPRVES